MKIIFYVLMALPLTMYGQLNGELHLFGDAGDNNRGSSAEILANGDIIFAGTFNIENDDIYLTRLTSNFDLVWEKNLGNNDSEFVNNMLLLEDSSIVIIGSVIDGIGNIDGFMIKTDLDGEQIWRTEFGLVDRNEDFYSLTQAANGDILVTGFSTAVEGSGNDILIARYNTDGEQQWRTVYGETVNDYGLGIVEAPSGDIFISADRFIEGLGYNGLLVACSSDGEVEWETLIDVPYNSGCKSLIINDAGKLIISGESGTAVSPVFDIFLVQLDFSGTIDWIKWVGEADLAEAGYDIAQAADESYIITGFGRNPATENNDILIVHTDASGEFIDKLYFGAEFVDYAYDIKVSSDGEYWVSGFSNQDGETYFALINGDLNIELDMHNQLNEALILVYPNPSTGSIQVESSNIENAILFVHNLNGELLLSCPLHQRQLSLPKGSFILRIEQDGQLIYTEKVLSL